MKALLLHCKNYKSAVTEKATRPKDIQIEEFGNESSECSDCVVALITAEKGDNPSMVVELIKEISKMAKEVGTKAIALLPFAHLSNNLASATEAITALRKVEEGLKTFEIHRAHFGSHKELLIDLYGHPGNARYREYLKSLAL